MEQNTKLLLTFPSILLVLPSVSKTHGPFSRGSYNKTIKDVVELIHSLEEAGRGHAG